MNEITQTTSVSHSAPTVEAESQTRPSPSRLEQQNEHENNTGSIGVTSPPPEVNGRIDFYA